MHERTHLDLFSGTGGFALAAQWNGVRTIGFCEREPYAQQVLKERFGAVADTKSERCGEEGELLHGEPKECASGGRPKIHNDIHQLDGTQYRGVWLLTGGFPCQPFSLAGKRLGASDERALWPEMLRVIDQARPAWVLGENVPGIITLELDRVLSDLEGVGYTCRPFVVPACAVDAKHRRDRVWIVANSSIGRRDGAREREDQLQRRTEAFGPSEDLANATGGGVRRGSASGQPGQPSFSGEALAYSNQPGLEWDRPEPRQGRPLQLPEKRCIWDPEPHVGRVVDGVPARAHRLRGLGNAIVPQVAAEFIRLMIAADELSACEKARLKHGRNE